MAPAHIGLVYEAAVTCPTPSIVANPVHKIDIASVFAGARNSVGVSGDGVTLAAAGAAVTATRAIYTINMVTGAKAEQLKWATGAAPSDLGVTMEPDGTIHYVQNVSSTATNGFGTSPSTTLVATWSYSAVGQLREIVWDETQGHHWVGGLGDWNTNEPGYDDPNLRNSAGLFTLTNAGTLTEVYNLPSVNRDASNLLELAWCRPLLGDGQGGCYFFEAPEVYDLPDTNFVSWIHTLSHYDPVNGVTSDIGHTPGFKIDNVPIALTPTGGLYVWNGSTQQMGFITAPPDLSFSIVSCPGPHVDVDTIDNKNFWCGAYQLDATTAGELTWALPEAENDDGPFGSAVYTT